MFSGFMENLASIILLFQIHTQRHTNPSDFHLWVHSEKQLNIALPQSGWVWNIMEAEAEPLLLLRHSLFHYLCTLPFSTISGHRLKTTKI